MWREISPRSNRTALALRPAVGAFYFTMRKNFMMTDNKEKRRLALEVTSCRLTQGVQARPGTGKVAANWLTLAARWARRNGFLCTAIRMEARAEVCLQAFTEVTA